MRMARKLRNKGSEVTKLMKSVWGAHVRTPEEDDLSEECVCEPLERAYVAIVHRRWLNETYYMPTKG